MGVARIALRGMDSKRIESANEIARKRS